MSSSSISNYFGDEEDYSWRDVQLGIRWNVSGGFVPAAHDEPLPTGSIASEGGAGWAHSEEEQLKPRMPGLKHHYESTDGAGGQFQGETNYGLIRRGATGPSKVVRHSIIDVANHGKKSATLQEASFRHDWTSPSRPTTWCIPGLGTSCSTWRSSTRRLQQDQVN